MVSTCRLNQFQVANRSLSLMSDTQSIRNTPSVPDGARQTSHPVPAWGGNIQAVGRTICSAGWVIADEILSGTDGEKNDQTNIRSWDETQ